MRHRRVGGVARRMAGVGLLAGAVGLGGGGVAQADEYHRDSDNGPRFTLVDVGQVDDPMEDVLEHVLLIGDGYRWD